MPHQTEWTRQALGLAVKTLALHEYRDGIRRILGQSLAIVVAIWLGVGVPHRWKHAMVIVLQEKTDRAECGNYRGILFVVHPGKVQCSPQKSTRQLLRPGEYPTRVAARLQIAKVDDKYDLHVRRPRQLVRKKSTPLYMCFVDLSQAYVSVDRTIF